MGKESEWYEVIITKYWMHQFAFGLRMKVFMWCLMRRIYPRIGEKYEQRNQGTHLPCWFLSGVQTLSDTWSLYNWNWNGFDWWWCNMIFQWIQWMTKGCRYFNSSASVWFGVRIKYTQMNRINSKVKWNSIEIINENSIELKNIW